MKTTRFLLSIMDCHSQFSRGRKSTAVRLTSFSPHLYNKTTSVEGRLSCVINLITSFLGKGLLKLGNEVRRVSCRVSTEVVQLMKSGINEVLNLMPTKKSTTNMGIMSSLAAIINVRFLPVHYRVNGITTRFLPASLYIFTLLGD